MANFAATDNPQNVTGSVEDIVQFKRAKRAGFEVPVSSITTVVQGGGTALVPIYRGFKDGGYVYSVGSPPSGATFVTIVGQKEQ